MLGVSTDSCDTTNGGSRRRRHRAGWRAEFPAGRRRGRRPSAGPTASTCRRQHLALRGLFLIDPNGVLQYQVVHNLRVGRSTEEILRVLEGLQMGGLCPADWQRGSRRMDPSQDLGPNRVLGPYRIEAELGGGSFGTVFRARDLTLDREVALKVLRPGSRCPRQPSWPRPGRRPP